MRTSGLRIAELPALYALGRVGDLPSIYPQAFTPLQLSLDSEA